MADSPGKKPTLSSLCGKSSADGNRADAQQRGGLHGRRTGRALGREQAEAWRTLLPVVAIDPGGEAGPVSPRRLFQTRVESCVLEIGFGDGGHLAAMMAARPQDGFIGAEPFRNGIASFLKSIRLRPLGAIRLWAEDAMLLVDRLEDSCLDEIYILNPDPWPKKRHAKRRIVNAANLDRLARVLKPGGLLVMTTDHDALAEWMVTHAARHPAFTWTAGKADDWRTPPPGWIETRYERKGREAGRRQTYLVFRRAAKVMS